MYLKHLVFLCLFLFQPMALAEVGSKYFCEGINEAEGYNLIFELKNRTTLMKFLKHEELNLIPEVKSKIVFQIDNYFMAYNEEEIGRLAQIFDGEMLITAHIQSKEKSNISYPKIVVGKYKCVKAI